MAVALQLMADAPRRSVLVPLSFIKPSDYEFYGGSGHWTILTTGSTAVMWHHSSGWCEPAVTCAVAAAPMTRSEVHASAAAVVAELHAIFDLKLRDVNAKLGMLETALAEKDSKFSDVHAKLFSLEVLVDVLLKDSSAERASSSATPPRSDASEAPSPVLTDVRLQPAPPSVNPPATSPRTTVPASETHSQCAHGTGSVLQHPLLSSGSHETNLEDWTNHLPATLFADDADKGNAFYAAMRKLWTSMEVMACRTQANRFYFVRCQRCHEYVYGEFGSWSEEHTWMIQQPLLDFVGATVPARVGAPSVWHVSFKTALLQAM